MRALVWIRVVWRILRENRFGGPGASIPLTAWSKFPLPFPLLSPTFLPLKSRPPLLRLGGLGSALATPVGPRAEPGRQTVFGEFQAKNLASSSNE